MSGGLQEDCEEKKEKLRTSFSTIIHTKGGALAAMVVGAMSVSLPAPGVLRSGSGIRVSRLQLFAGLAALVAICGELIVQLHLDWSLNPSYTYGWSVPFLAALPFWMRWNTRPAQSAVLSKNLVLAPWPTTSFDDNLARFISG
jgi:hypothetical protein